VQHVHCTAYLELRNSLLSPQLSTDIPLSRRKELYRSRYISIYLLACTYFKMFRNSRYLGFFKNLLRKLRILRASHGDEGNLRECLKTLFLLQFHHFGYGFVTPPRRIASLYAFVVVPCLARNDKISSRNKVLNTL